jgi:hypothetical protein
MRNISLQRIIPYRLGVTTKRKATIVMPKTLKTTKITPKIAPKIAQKRKQFTIEILLRYTILRHNDLTSTILIINKIYFCFLVDRAF